MRGRVSYLLRQNPRVLGPAGSPPGTGVGAEDARASGTARTRGRKMAALRARGRRDPSSARRGRGERRRRRRREVGSGWVAVAAAVGRRKGKAE